MTDAILSLLVCPLTKQHLLPPSSRLAEALQIALDDQSLVYLDGTQVTFPESYRRVDKQRTSTDATPAAIENSKELQFLVSENQQHIYSVIKGVPLLLEAKQVILSI